MNFLKLTIGPFFGGIIFALGLGISGMTEPQKIIAFLDIFGEWDPSLVFVMVGAISTHALLRPLVMKRPTPLFDNKFYLPTATTLDKKLICGAALFGAGWGISGLCPGPGLTTLVTGTPYGLVFIGCLLTGMLAARFLERKF